MVLCFTNRLRRLIAVTSSGLNASKGVSSNFFRTYASVWPDNFGWGLNHLYPPKPPKSFFSTDRKQAAELNNELIKKYKVKLERKAKSEGVASIDELFKKHTYKTTSQKQVPIEAKLLDESLETPKEDTSFDFPKHSATKADPFCNNGFNTSLSKIMKMDKIMNETSETIAQLWTAQHAKKECLSAVIPGETYRTLLKRFQECPQFLIPIPRENGHEFYFMQSHFHQIYFTSLLEYKTNGSQARPHLILIHYPELLEIKGIVLMRGELGNDPNDPNGRIPLSLEDAKLLVYLFQQFYIFGGQEKRKLVETFNFAPNEFDYKKLLEKANQIN